MNENKDTSQVQLASSSSQPQPKTNATPVATSDQISSLLASAPSSLRAIFAPILCIDEKNMYVESSCVICASKHRIDAETLYKGFDQYVPSQDRERSVKNFFEGKGEYITIDAIRNHMSRHMDRGDREIRKSEYLGKLDSINISKLSSIDIMDRAINVIWERILAQNEMAPDGKYSIVDVMDLMTKNVSSLTGVLLKAMQFRSDLLGEMRKDGSAFVIPKDVFDKVFDTAMDKAKTKEEREIVAFILKSLGGI